MSGIRLRIAAVEGAQLSRLVADFIDLVGVERDLTDPAVNRLAPTPYPGDEEASRAFGDATRDDLLDRRRHDAETVRLALTPFEVDVESLGGAAATSMRDLEIAVGDVDAWLRTLTALRLVVANRLGIENDDDHSPDDARFGVYDWLGHRLESVVQAADELL